MSKKSIAVVLALVLLVGCVAGGTLAWLTDNTNTVTNTFTVGNINIDLSETVSGSNQSAADNAVTNNGFKIIPGATEAKDPKVTVKANSEDCWVFVQVKEVNNSDPKYVVWEIADGWTQLGDATNGVYTYYRSSNYTTATSDTDYYVLKGGADTNTNGQVSYPGTLTKENIDALNAESATKPQLIFKAFAVQSDNLTKDDGTAITSAADAWELVDSNKKLS